MKDTIYRQDAIDALNEYFARIEKLKGRGLTKGEQAISLDTVGVIETLPPKEITQEDVEAYCRPRGLVVMTAELFECLKRGLSSAVALEKLIDENIITFGSNAQSIIFYAYRNDLINGHEYKELYNKALKKYLKNYEVTDD